PDLSLSETDKKEERKKYVKKLHRKSKIKQKRNHLNENATKLASGRANYGEHTGLTNVQGEPSRISGGQVTKVAFFPENPLKSMGLHPKLFAFNLPHRNAFVHLSRCV